MPRKNKNVRQKNRSRAAQKALGGKNNGGGKGHKSRHGCKEERER